MAFGLEICEVWRGGAEENLLTRMRPCEMCRALIRRVLFYPLSGD